MRMLFEPEKMKYRGEEYDCIYILIRSAMNPQVFLDLVKSSRSQLTEREYTKIVARAEEVTRQSKDWYDEAFVAKRLFMSGCSVDSHHCI